MNLDFSVTRHRSLKSGTAGYRVLLWAGLLFAASPGFAGEGGPPSTPLPTPLQPEAFSWDCSGMADPVVSHQKPGEDSLWLFLPEETVQLPSLRTASGAAWSNGRIHFWTKGREAMLEHNDVRVLKCTENRRRSLVEDAKLRGMDFRGYGNEPPWVLEIGSTELILFTGYERLRHVFPNQGSTDNQARRTAQWSSESPHGKLKVVLTGRECSDSMSGEMSETTVTVTLNNRTLQGCGQALH